MSTGSPRRLAAAMLISGGGTTFHNLLAYARSGKLDLDFKLVVSSSASAGGLNAAREASIPTCIVERDRCDNDEAFSRPIFDACRAAGVDVVLMGGFLKFAPIPPDFAGRVLNIHPSLIPAFCGKGFYGLRVHQAAIDYGVRVTGCTVHFVDNQYDHGPIILQRVVEVRDSDTAET
ncbi:MAG: phosphoribosylglycinamide formyltransferase, partial [Pirellulaceae bacterium]